MPVERNPRVASAQLPSPRLLVARLCVTGRRGDLRVRHPGSALLHAFVLAGASGYFPAADFLVLA